MATAAIGMSLATAAKAVPVADPMICDASKTKVLGSLLLGGKRFGAVERSKVGQLGIAGLDKLARVTTTLTDAVARRLNHAERQQASAATTIAVCKGRPGETVRWASGSRAGVTGSSTVTSMRDDPLRGRCITVADVIVADGEEARVIKRMCRAAGAAGFTLVA